MGGYDACGGVIRRDCAWVPGLMLARLDLEQVSRWRAAQKLTCRQVRPASWVSISWPAKPLLAGPWMTTPSLAVVNPRSAQPYPPSGSVSTVCHCAAPSPE